MRKPEKSKVRISIATAVDTTTWEFGRQVLDTFSAADARLLPERVGNFEPVKIPVESVGSCEEHWAPDGIVEGPEGKFAFKWGFLWTRTKAIKSRGNMMHTARIGDGDLKLGWLTFTGDPDRKVDWAELFRRLCALAQPKFATLHLLTDIEARPGAFSPENDENYDTNDFHLGAPGIALEKRGIPNLAWANFFGEGYASEVSAQIFRDKGFQVDPIGGGFLVALTPKFFDVADDFAKFSARRVALKKLFRPGLFRITDEPRSLS